MSDTTATTTAAASAAAQQTNGGERSVAAAAAPGRAKQNEKEARKAARLAEEQARAAEKAALLARYADTFGDAAVVQSTTYRAHTFTAVRALSDALVGQRVHVRARVSTTRKKGKLAFMVLRDEGCSVQAMAALEDGVVPKEMIDYIGQIPCESIVDVDATVCAAAQPVLSTTHSSLELKLCRVHTVTSALRVLPYTIEDASRGDADDGAKVNLDTRLNCRWLDLRTAATGAVFRLQSRVCEYFREYLLRHDFCEIHSPKIINAPSEGGANVFRVEYFTRAAYLAQSPQLYKQMAIQGDLPRVFEVGPVFRAENSNTHRHLTEFVGLDLEMRIAEHYYEILDVAEELFHHIFSRLAQHTSELAAVCRQYPFEPLVWQVPEATMRELGIGVIADKAASTDTYGACVRDAQTRMLRLNYAHCIALLNTALAADGEGAALDVTDDINTTNEKRLGQLVKARYGVDFFVADRFPSSVRPFYTMPCADDARFTNSYDLFIRGEEICSGAQRIHVPEMLLARAAALKVDLTPIQDYVDSFKLGAWPHGGLGVGLERVVMLYLGLGNVRLASLFPRDPQRTTP